MKTASVVIRTYNEQRYLPDLLEAVQNQDTNGFRHETIVVDSGSTDRTLSIAREHGVRLVHIDKEEFSFGRSLNYGCRAAEGEALVFISGHCVPADDRWLNNLIRPVREGTVDYAYGRQIGDEHRAKWSEIQIFRKYFPETSRVPQEGFFVNNANAALSHAAWEEFGFDEELTGLEDMFLGKKLVEAGRKLGYVADASVYHHHHEDWRQIKRRYQREAIALQQIMPEVQVSLADFFRYFLSAFLMDCALALHDRRLLQRFADCFLFRLAQYWGSYRGNHDHRKMSRRRKEKYFFPR